MLEIRVMSKYFWLFKEDVMRFDFEVEEVDEKMVYWFMNGIM